MTIQQPPLITPITPSVPPVNDILQPVAAGTRGVPIFVGAYDAGTTYNQGNIVTYEGSSWSARVTTAGNAPPTLPVEVNTWWFLTARKGDNTTSTQINADWNATSGAAEILNKPTIPSSADFATAAQGAKADTAIQPADLATVATTGDYSDLTGTPSLGSAASQNSTAFATAAQGAKADTAVQPGSLATVATSGAYSDLSGRPTLGTLAAKSAVAVADITATGTPSGSTYLRGDGAWSSVTNGTVTSVSLTVPTGLSASGSPITTSGTFAVTYAAGYQGYTTTEASKLAGIAAGAEVNVNADWNAASGDAQILNKPTLGSLAAKSSINNADWSGTDLAVANGGTGASDASGARTNLGLGALAVKSAVDIADISATGTPSGTTYLRGDGTWETPEGGGGGGSGTVTSVAVTVPTGFDVTGSPITNSGTIAIAYASGYQGYTTTEATKLSGIATGATANDTDANLKSRANHTGTQLADTISDFSTAADGRLSAAIGSTVQAYSAKLAAIDGLTWAADRFAYFTGTSTAAIGTITTFGRSLIDDADAATARTTLGLVIGTNVQAFNAKLGTLAGQTWAADRYTYYTSASAAAIGTLTAFGRSLIDDADAATARTTLGLGSLATVSVSPGASGNVLTSNGSAWTSAAPAGGGGMVPLGSLINVTSAVAAVDISLTGTYDEYVLKFWELKPATDNQEIWMRTSTDGTTFDTGASDYQYAGSFENVGGGSSTAYQSAGDTKFRVSIGRNIGNATNENGIYGEIRFFRPKEAKYSIWEMSVNFLDANTVLNGGRLAGVRVTAADVVAVRFLAQTGNIATFRGQLYGVVTS